MVQGGVTVVTVTTVVVQLPRRFCYMFPGLACLRAACLRCVCVFPGGSRCSSVVLCRDDGVPTRCTVRQRTVQVSFLAPGVLGGEGIDSCVLRT